MNRSYVVRVMLGLGYVLLGVELFVLPGSGVLAVTAILCWGAASFLALTGPDAAETTSLEPGTARRRAGPQAAAVGTVTGALFFAIGYERINNAHPHEDAYILFRYVENIVAGHGIAFNVGGPRSEGATDFLWLMLVSGSTALGLDVAVAALILNSIGAALIGTLLAGSLKPLPRG